jgi:predicted nuclease with TOPRIM domain
LVRDLDKALKEVNLLGEHGEEPIQKITELEALCNKLREDSKKLRGEKAKLERMVESRNKLIMEFTDKDGYNRNDEDADDEDEDDATEEMSLHPCYCATPCCCATYCCPRGDHH